MVNKIKAREAKVDRVKFDDIYSKEISMYQRKENVGYSQALDKLWTEFVRVEFNEKIYADITLIKLLWKKT